MYKVVMEELIQASVDTPSPRQISKNWVWHSSPEAIAKGQKSVLACIEIPISFGLFWWFASYTPFPLLTLIAFLAVPFLLLRSDESIADGEKRLRAYWHRDADEKPTRFKFWLIVSLSAALSGAISYILASHWLPGHAGWALIWRSMFIGYAAFALAVAVAVTVAGTVALAVTVAVAVAGTVTLAVTVAAGAGAGAVVVAGTFAVMVTGAGAVAVAGAGAGAIAGAGAGAVAGAFVAPPIVLGVFLRTLGIRMLATLSNFGAGLRQLSQNCHQSLLVIDNCHQPELIPNADKVSGLFNYLTILKKTYESATENIFNKVFGLLFALITWLPALAYRVNLKANAWLWLPLAYLFRKPAELISSPKVRDKISVITAGYWAKRREWLCGLVGLWLVTPLFSLPMKAMADKTPFGEILKSAGNFLAPPTILSLRYVLLWVCVVLFWWLTYQSENYLAAHKKAAEAQKDHNDNIANPETKTHLEGKMLSLGNLYTWCLIIFIATIYTHVLWYIQTHWAERTQHMLWAWLKNVL